MSLRPANNIHARQAAAAARASRWARWAAGAARRPAGAIGASLPMAWIARALRWQQGGALAVAVRARAQAAVWSGAGGQVGAPRGAGGRRRPAVQRCAALRRAACRLGPLERLSVERVQASAGAMQRPSSLPLVCLFTSGRCTQALPALPPARPGSALDQVLDAPTTPANALSLLAPAPAPAPPPRAIAAAVTRDVRPLGPTPRRAALPHGGLTPNSSSWRRGWSSGAATWWAQGCCGRSIDPSSRRASSSCSSAGRGSASR